MNYFDSPPSRYLVEVATRPASEFAEIDRQEIRPPVPVDAGVRLG
jgi:hypothetical protein